MHVCASAAGLWSYTIKIHKTRERAVMTSIENTCIIICKIYIHVYYVTLTTICTYL